MAGVFLVSEFGVFWSRVLIGVFLVFEFGVFICVVIMFAFFWCLSLAFFLELCFRWRSLCASVCLFFFWGGGGGLLSLALFFWCLNSISFWSAACCVMIVTLCFVLERVLFCCFGITV